MKCVARQLLAGIVALLLLSVLPIVPPAPANGAPVPVLPVEALKPGMRGYGRTVFQGTRIDTFSVEILGVLKNVTPRGDIILARAEGGPLAKSGIIAGMSGSPIYVDGKLIGALAYGWDFSAEAIAGITPIDEMLPIFARGGSADGAKELGEALPGSGGMAPERAALSTESNPGSLLPIPIATPLALGGFTGEAVRAMEPWLSGLGFRVSVGGGGAGEAGDEAVRLEPGSAIGVQFVDGDASVAAIGTVTWMDGDRILAFGHPLLSSGTERYPMTTARIQAILPSLQSSFKMGTAIRSVGQINRDFSTGIAGAIGPPPELCPLTIVVSGTDAGEETFHYRFLPTRFLAPGILGYLAFNSFTAGERSIGESTLEVESTYRIRGQEPLVVSDIFSGLQPPTTVADAVSRPANILLSNPLEPVSLQDVSIRVNVKRGMRVASIREIGVDREVYHPGEEVRVQVSLQPYRDAPFRKEILLRIPADADPGRRTLKVCDGASTNGQERERAPGRFQMTSLDDLRRVVSEMFPSDALVVRLAASAPSAVVNGREFPGLPPSVLYAMGTPNLSGARMLAKESIDAERVERTGWVLSGCQSLQIQIEPR